jgi:cellulose biosynthesis protein BcsQ
MMTINALAAADSVIIPVQAHYLPAKGMTQLLQTIARVRRQINPRLTIDGVLLTMVDNRTISQRIFPLSYGGTTATSCLFFKRKSPYPSGG